MIDPEFDPEKVPVRDAATVMLLRDGASGVEAWLLTRHARMVFAAGMTVFPGGRVEDSDADLPFTESGTGVAAARFDCDEATARALVGAAVRETFEETGVLLSRPVADLSAARADVELGRVHFGELLRANGLAVDAEVLEPWARWITPVGESRRYDTRFFVGAMPESAEARDVTSEAASASWMGVEEALARAERGELRLLPPTLVTLTSLLPFGTVAETLAAAAQREISAVQPEIRFENEHMVAVLPDGTQVRVPLSMFRGRS